ncbi:hypothetical protein [Tahibacter soli]|jgi:hypothetical protein|uniref:DUF3619 family protein n=1 Tax=Tahibacter soli TaxID=2983605 RepID=A0A9X4BIJ3_9GAMM|nr:hypothetical protein [Tahibacter soli]MDC8013678.1 hypothetical protein [Tahibacter soli]
MNARDDRRDDAPPEWTAQARELLDASADALDGATASRLNRARQRALAARARPARRWWLPAGAATMASVLLALVVVNPLTRPAPEPAIAVPALAAGGADDAELIVADDNLELAQDLEFYAWLDAEDEHNG